MATDGNADSATDPLAAAEEAFEREDYESAFQLLLPCADAGNSEAQVKLAVLYQTGLGVERSVTEAERWFLRAANQNNLVAWNQLGLLYASKHLELKDRWGDAQKCFEKTKELGAKAAGPHPHGKVDRGE